MTYLGPDTRPARPAPPASLSRVLAGLLLACSVGSAPVLGLSAAAAGTADPPGPGVAAASALEPLPPGGPARLMLAAPVRMVLGVGSSRAVDRGAVNLSVSRRLGFGWRLRVGRRRPAVSTPGPGSARQTAGEIADGLAGQLQLAMDEVAGDAPASVPAPAIEVLRGGRPDRENIAVQLSARAELSVLPFLEGFREPEAELGRATGRLMQGTAGLALVTADDWTYRLQLSRQFLNTLMDGAVATKIGLALRRRF